jgi:2-methylcitrate dehydratase PrpD
MGAGGETGGCEARLSAALARSRYDDVPDPVVEHAVRGIVNAAACVLAGREDPGVRILAATFPEDHALLDAAAATAHDYDDTHLATVIHATPPVAGALFALARRQEVTDVELVHAFALGTEVTCRLGNVVTPGHYERGWHITSTCGVFGAAVAAAKILKLDEREMLDALGLAATQASGLVEMLGSMGRVLNAGFAARNGLAAAQLAARGFHGPQRPLEGLRAFLNVFGGSREVDRLTDGFGERWEMTRVVFKPYPCGVVLHALLDACLEHRADIAKAEEVRVTLHPLAIERTDRPAARDAIEARLSVQHAVAVAALRGRAGLAEFSEEALADPALRAFRRRVQISADDTLDKMAAIIRVGDKTIKAPAPRPLTDERLATKVRELAGDRADGVLALSGELAGRRTGRNGAGAAGRSAVLHLLKVLNRS